MLQRGDSVPLYSRRTGFVQRQEGISVRSVYLAALLLCTPAAAFAQTDSDSQVWLTASASTEIADGVELSLETVLRFGDDADGLYEGEYGGDLGFAVGDGVELSAGYLRVPQYSRAGVTALEDRARQAISFGMGEFAGGKLSARVRLEERWRNTGSDTGFRLRPRLSWSRPFTPEGKTALVVSHESYIELNDTDWGQSSGYERMRNFVGVTTPLVEGVKVEGGYLNQWGVKRDGDPASVDHVLTLSLAYSF
ncbi:DUF2490 domain-containing protein [Sphingomonas gilva]|uniref:DUF2490 domain-containing protein n=1 Tax=Sphingomonas gilva TaxID=2305907 RepID=A0A396RK92_9SPHN|nr:DUF2490 domain-containing protein [Sphingomonas gilva]RHW16610.1 DUF2490 domain-containing protein [Sphingomonas gilva]